MDTLFYFLIVIGEVVAIHVSALEVTAIVTSHNAIWVDHRNDPSVKSFSKLLNEQILTQQLVNEAVDNEAAVGFARMLPANYENNRLVVILLKFLIHAADLDERDIKPT